MAPNLYRELPTKHKVGHRTAMAINAMKAPREVDSTTPYKATRPLPASKSRTPQRLVSHNSASTPRMPNNE